MKIRNIIYIGLLLVITSFITLASAEEFTPLIDLEAGYIIVDGFGIAPVNVTSENVQQDLARLAAKLDAQRNLLEMIVNLQLDENISIETDISDNRIKTQIEGVLQGAEIVPDSEEFQDGVFHLRMQVQVKKLTPIVYPAPVKVEEANTGSETAYAYTGLIINAQPFSLIQTESWEVRDLEGKLIYASTRALYKPGSSLFKSDEATAYAEPRIGNNPLIIQASKSQGQVLFISVEDGQYILTTLQDTDVFLLSKIAVIIGGSNNE